MDKSKFVKVAKSDLRNFARVKPDGYYEDVVANAEYENDSIVALTQEKFAALREKYAGKVVDRAEQRSAKPMRKRLTPWQILKGATGLLQDALNIGIVDDETYIERKQTCLNCPDELYDFGVCGGSGCQCYLAAKIRIKDQSCPKGHWAKA